MKHIHTLEQFLGESVAAPTEQGNFTLEMLYVRDQAHIFHWQTNSFAQHEAFGSFYEDYLELVDGIAEQVFGKMGKFHLGGQGTITLTDYSAGAVMPYLDQTEDIFRNRMKQVVPVEGNEEIYNTVEEVLSLVNKLRYLLTLG